jgi:hypothetical protein
MHGEALAGVLDRLRHLGEPPGASRIREIQTRGHYWRLQD